MNYELSSTIKESLLKVIESRRDIRSFKNNPILPATILKILHAGHQAPSVGFSQPWNFLIIDDKKKHREVYDHFLEENAKASKLFQDSQGETYRSLKLQGLLDAPIHLVVTCDSNRNGKHVLGRTSVKEVDEYSVCLAIQNIWLTARAEGIGVGWMSIYDPILLPKILQIPDSIKIIAYLCLGEPVEIPDDPLLETTGWKNRENLNDLVFWNKWGNAFGSEKKKSEELKEIGSNQISNFTIPSPEFLNQDEFDEIRFQNRLNQLTKPIGSLGKLEEYTYKIAQIQNRMFPKLTKKTILILAGDHGISEEKVSAYSQSSTYKMVYQYLAGGGAISSFARGVGADLFVADLGVNHNFPSNAKILGKKIRLGSRNFLKEPALTEEEVELAIQVGKGLWKEIPKTDILSLGEVGMGNTTASVCLASLIFDLDIKLLLDEGWIGKGTGVDKEGLIRKELVISKSLQLYKKDSNFYSNYPCKALSAVGGLEIAGMVGVVLGGVDQNTPIVLDGLISTLAGGIASLINPEVKKNIFIGHRSSEKLHYKICSLLGIEPILDLDLRLGEATGSTLAIGILEQACRSFEEMKTWEEVNWFEENLM
jgi:nicotinate-nucleotide--dimethylbenzimidazole phosphoribosyltransferase